VTVGGSVIAAAVLSLWAAWDAAPGRAVRRRLGWPVPPRNVLYMTVNGGLAIVRGRSVTLVPYNPAAARTIAVSSDLGIRTMPALPPWTMGGSFRLDGTLVPAASIPSLHLCCFGDGTTDGRFNYAVRLDDTLLEPIGSRPMAPAGLYQFDRDWSNPRLYMPLVPEGSYFGVTYTAASDSFWMTRNLSGASVLERWNREGKHLSTSASLPGATLTGIAFDPRDETLWVMRPQPAAAVMRLENFDSSGRHLGSLDLTWPHPFLQADGAEFEWIGQK
jgi:hypothetical protein